MAKRKQTAGERMIQDLCHAMIEEWGHLPGYEGFKGWKSDADLASHFRQYARRIDRAIKAAEKRERREERELRNLIASEDSDAAGMAAAYG